MDPMGFMDDTSFIAVFCHFSAVESDFNVLPVLASRNCDERNYLYMTTSPKPLRRNR